jgi:23S rRNA pseudouridine1911/1915/1917 synthase
LKNKIEIIYEDEHIIAINKPTGVSVTKDRSGLADISDLLDKQLKPEPPLRLIHRLDKGTSGIMIMGKTLEAQSLFSSGFEKRLFKKTYLVLVSGYVSSPKGRIKAPIARSLRDVKQMCISAKRGKESITDFKLLAEFGIVSLIAAMPVTGRTHQIRVHCANRNMPLAIDPVYGGKKPIMLSDYKAGYGVTRGKKENPLIERLTLHAYQLELPKTDLTEPMTLVAKLDKKFAAAVKMLTKHNQNGQEAFLDYTDFERIVAGEPL